LGISDASLSQRIDKLGWPLEKALTKKKSSRWGRVFEKLISTTGLRCSFCLKGIIEDRNVDTQHIWSDEYGGYKVKYKCSFCKEAGK